MNIAFGQWIATIANQRAEHTGQTPVQELTAMLERVGIKAGAPDGDDDAGLLRWRKARAPLLPAAETEPGAQLSSEPAT